MRMTELKRGWQLVGNDGRRLGTIRDVGQNFVVVSRFGFSGDLYVPASAIANVANGVVHLNLPKSTAEAMGWEQPPREPDDLETDQDSDLHRHI